MKTGNPAELKALIDALVADIKITGPGTIRPLFRVPQPSNDAELDASGAAAASPATTAPKDAVRTLRGPVGRGGVEPPTFRFSGERSYRLSYLPWCGPPVVDNP